MAREYFHAYYSYLQSMEPLNDAECGRLFRALLQYSKTGECEELRGNERFVFPTMRAQIDRDNHKYENQCQKNAEKREIRRQTQKQTTTGFLRNPKSQGKGKDKGKDKEKKAKAKGYRSACAFL